jgi:NAD(P)-dependent dehydrogenase (short-subunit alcohol dehydrogenase family)
MSSQSCYHGMSTFLIIGASSGIGAALAQLLADEGHRVIGTFATHPMASSQIEFHPLDITVDQPDFSFLPDKIDGLAYCPGAISLKPFHRIKPTDFVEDFQLQVVGAIKTLQATFPALKASGQGSVLLFSTVAVQTGLGFHAQVAASKGALEGLTRSLAAEWAPTIRINAIAPSLTDTPLAASLLNNDEKRAANAQRHALKRIGTPEDMAKAGKFLLTDDSGWITGQILHVDGGFGNLK